MAASNLARLAAFTGEPVYAERLALLFSAFAQESGNAATDSARLMASVSDRAAGLREVVLVETGTAAEGEAMLAPLRTLFAPNRVLIRVRSDADSERLVRSLPIIRGKRTIEGKTTAYVCENRVCQYPTNDPDRFAAQLEATSAPMPAAPTAAPTLAAP